MAATAAQVWRLRRMVAESDDTTYADSDLAEAIERYPLPDSEQRDPDHLDWVATYDLHAAAAEVWQEKAAALSTAYDFNADGAVYSRSQMHEQALKQARWHNSRRAAVGARLITTFEEATEWPTA
jgi:hypothetical protein